MTSIPEDIMEAKNDILRALTRGHIGTTEHGDQVEMTQITAEMLVDDIEALVRAILNNKGEER